MNGTEFDFIICGGGTAGCVLAARLSEDPHCQVVLVEAGKSNHCPLVPMPLAFPFLAKHRQLNWFYRGEEEEAAEHRSLAVRMGRGLGGSSLINGLIYTRGHPRDYDEWGELGLQSWRYADVAPWFIRAESHWRGAGEQHGGSGPIAVTRPASPLATTEPIMQAGRSLGIAVIDDLAAPPFEGMARPEFAIDRNGRRVSSASAYLRDAGRRSNLRVLTGAKVLRVVLENKRAVGVEIAVGRKVSVLRARQEVIVSSGAYQSPQVLMLSGIGDADSLRAVGVKPLVHLPGVGANLQNHASVVMVHRLANPITFYSKLRADRMALAALRWLAFGGGAVGQLPLSVTGFLRTRAGLNRPNIQALYTEGTFEDRPWLPPSGAHRLTIHNTLLRPLSRGWVKLAGADPSAVPRLKFNLLSESNDAATLCESVKLQRELLEALARQGMASTEIQPGSSVFDGDLMAFVRARATVSQHPVGTCAMGVGSDSVVDGELKVHGVQALRVVDASVAPRIVSANTYAMTLMIAERGAAFIAAANGLASASAKLWARAAPGPERQMHAIS